MLKYSCFLILLCGCFALHAADAKPAKTKVDKRAAEMDYGPYLATTVGAGKDNITPKGIVIRLDKEKNANICFDTELMRVTAAWSGGYLNLASRVFADNNNDFSTVDGDIQFATKIRPGWAKDDQREDPRASSVPGDPKSAKDGPLPADWAKYKGLYIHGDEIVLSYTVGACPVLELPSVKFHGDNAAFTRTFKLGASEKALTLLVCELDDADKTASGVGPAGQPIGTAQNGSAETQIACLATGTSTTAAGVTGAPKGAEWEIAGSRTYLKLPKLDAPAAFTLTVSKIPNADLPGFSAFLNNPVSDPGELTHGGPAHWKETVVTQGVLASSADPKAPDAAYVIDTLTAPEQNPYKSWMRFTGFDFFADGKRAAICTWSGDVWIVSGIDANLQNLDWKRFATGLSQPLGLKIVDDVIYTAGRDQITRLHDLNNDGEADFYENFNNDCTLTTNFHEFALDLQTDKEGNFYYAKGSSIWAGSQRMAADSGCFIKVSKDGSQFEVLASGLRAPNGVAVGPHGELTCTDNQGNWVPECPINLIKKGGYYGFVGQGQKTREREKPLCWIPYNIDKSSGSQVWVPSEKWGPFKDHMLQTSYDCSVFEVLFEYVGDEAQGGTVRFPLTFPSGIMRCRFNPADGQLYVCGLRGWSSRANKECILQRVRYTNKPVYMPIEVHTRKTGMDVTFTGALDPASVADTQNIGAEWFNVVRTAAYGSPEFSVADPKKKGRDQVEIKSAKLSADGKTISLEIPTLKPVTNIVLKFKIKAADGTAVNQELDYTINKMPE